MLLSFAISTRSKSIPDTTNDVWICGGAHVTVDDSSLTKQATNKRTTASGITLGLALPVAVAVPVLVPVDIAQRLSTR
jgi:hypothetical protein